MSMIPRRLDKYLADATSLSRSEIEDAWEAGRIDIRPGAEHERGEYELWSLIFGADQVLLDGNPVTPTEPAHYFAFHKPVDVLSTTNNPEGRRCLQPWLDDLPEGLFPVGRLDRQTTGFLLFTDDGDLCFCLLRPWFHVEKEYHLTVGGGVEAGDSRLSALEDGVDIGDGKPPVAALSTDVLRSSHHQSLVSVVVDQGRHRMVRRMARRTDLDLKHLHRPRIGPVELGEVAAGEVRELSDDEVHALWTACGGKQATKNRQIAALERQAEKWRRQQRRHHRLERWLARHG